MSSNKEKSPGGRIPGNRQGGTTVPGSPRSGPCAEPCEGPKPIEELSTGSRSANVTAEKKEENVIRSIIDQYLGPSISGAPQHAGDNDSEDYMSVTGLSSATPLKKRVRERESLSDSDVEGMPLRSRKILRPRILGSDSDNVDDAVTLSDSPKEVAAKVRGKKTRKQKLEKLDKLDQLDESIESSRVVFTDCPSRLSYEDLQNKDVDEIMAVSEG